mmetsp:Transcript_58455/g.130579  ORF Transcript_58455/g.130579 Transcript_58455/m.130579 type:complete len:363 (+) Transcript_58455:75-1163(+)
MALKEDSRPEDASSGFASTSAATVDNPSPPAGGLASRPYKPLDRPPPAIILDGIFGPGGSRTKLEGQIKSFYLQRGFGFISCERVWELLRCDVYFTLNEVYDVEASQVEEKVRKGVKCNFFFSLNRESKPQARVVRIQADADDRPDKGGNPKFDAEDQLYTGKIKSFNASKGYGFISCDATFARFNRDVFLHHSQLNGLKAGDDVQFKIFVDKSKADAQAKALEVKAVATKDTSAEASAQKEAEAEVASVGAEEAPGKAQARGDLTPTSTPTSPPNSTAANSKDDIFLSNPAQPREGDVETSRPEEGWTRYVTEEQEYWWYCCKTDEWFMEKEPGQWSEFVDTATSRKYWFHSDGRCFWANA